MTQTSATHSPQPDMSRIPAHVAIIMDGNGRWAQAHGKERSYGHQQGVETVRKITEEATRLGIKYLTLYTFSTENWNRPDQEVAALMGLILSSLEEELFRKNNVRFKVIGDVERLPQPVREKIETCIKNTAGNTRMTLVVALSYSSKWELTRAVRLLADEVSQGALSPADIDENSIASHLQTAFMPDPDLLIRTGGEVRLSNYLLWQCAYSELYFCPTYWPDFDEAALREAIVQYQNRERRFGQTGEQIKNHPIR